MQQTKLKGLTNEELDQLAINTIRTLSIDAAGHVISMETFGASAPLKELQHKFGFEPERLRLMLCATLVFDESSASKTA